MGTKHSFIKCWRYLTISSIAILTIVIIFSLLMYFYLNNIAEDERLVLVRLGSVLIYVPSEQILLIYVWEIFWLCLSLLLASILRIWLTYFWLHFCLFCYLGAVIFTPFLSYELSIFTIAYFKTMTIYCLLILQQKIAHRDINDRGYEVHQNQFNLIYRRVLHITS